MYNASQELDKVANFPNIRLIYVAMIPSNKPEYELLGLNQPWALPTKGIVANCSKILYMNINYYYYSGTNIDSNSADHMVMVFVD